MSESTANSPILRTPNSQIQGGTVTFTLKPRTRQVRLSETTVTVNLDDTQHDLSKRIARISHLPINRLRITFENSTKVVDSRTHPQDPPKVRDIADEGTVLVVKDLGPQLSWRVVYFVEYLGPLLLHPLFYYIQQPFYGHNFDHSSMQKMTLTMVLIHFLKREYETLFIHRFSADTMPFIYIFRNSAHYWALGGLIFAYTVYHPSNSHIIRTPIQIILTIIFYMYAELSNLVTHITLSRLRSEGTRIRRIPHGYGFDRPFGGISFPNYFFEIMAWMVIALWSWTWGIIPFFAVAVFIMDKWAQTKHRKYKREFPDYPKRSALFPWVR